MREKEIIKQLENKGERVTPARRAVIRILDHARGPLSAAEILGKLKGLINRTTVYREVWFLKAQGLLKEVSFLEGKSRFELVTDCCHHHLVCEECGGVEEVELNEKVILNQVKKLSNFQLQRHSIEFFGLCNNCQ